MQIIKNIILDYGNVIFMIDFERSRQAFISLGIKNVDEFFAHSGQDPLFDALDKGKISAAEFRNGIRERSGKAELSDAQIDEAWNALLIGVPEGKHDTISYLNSKYRSFLLSNNNEIHYRRCMEHIQETYQVADNSGFFEKTFYSHLMGMRKPDAEIFEQLIQDTGINPAETLFIDDSPQHLATAQSLGFLTALCTKENNLESIVAQYGL